MSSAVSVLFNSTRQCNGTCFRNMLSVDCLHSVCFPFIFNFFSFPLSRPPNSFLLMCLLLSYIYPFSIINSSIFDAWFLFSFCCHHQNCAVIFLSILFIHSLPAFLKYIILSPPHHPGCPTAPLYPLFLHRNGHPFLLAFVTHSYVLSWHFTGDVPSHPASRHLITELSLQLDFANDDISDPCVLRKVGLWSIIADISVYSTNWAVEIVGILRERGLKYVSCSYSCLLNGCSLACILWAVDLN